MKDTTKSTSVEDLFLRLAVVLTSLPYRLATRCSMDLLGSILGSMEKPPSASEKEKKMAKGICGH